LGVATDDDRDALRRLRPADALVELDVGVVHRRLRLGPQGAHRLDVVVVATPAVGERHADRIELLLQPADPDPEDHATATQVVDRRDLLRGDQGVALRDDEDARRELDPLGHRGHVGQPDERVRQVELLGAAGHLARPVVRVLRLVAARHDDVLDGPERLEPGALGDRRQLASPRCRRAHPGVGEHQAELHGRAP